MVKWLTFLMKDFQKEIFNSVVWQEYRQCLSDMVPYVKKCQSNKYNKDTQLDICLNIIENDNFTTTTC